MMNTLGADVLRLWVAAADYRGEMRVSDEILKRVSDAYRRIRNTARFLLGNLDGFDPADALPAQKLLPLDRWAVDCAAQLQAEVVQAYADYQFLQVYQKVHNFCAFEMGAFYLDILKDRSLYHRAQTATRAAPPKPPCTTYWKPGSLDRARTQFHCRGNSPARAGPSQ